MSLIVSDEVRATAGSWSCTQPHSGCNQIIMQIRDESDESLARRAGSDPDAMTELYRRHRPGVERHCRMKIADPDRALDIVSQVWLKALVALREQEREVEKFCSWITTITHHEIVNSYRASQREVRLDDTFDRPHSGPTADDIAIANDFYLKYREIADRILNPDEQRVVELRAAGLTNPEICELMGKSYSWVSSTHFRAIRKLAAAWNNWLREGESQ